MNEELALPSVPTIERTTARAKKAPPPSAELIELREMNAKLDRVIAVLAAQDKDKDKQIAILSAAGCDSAFIGTLVGMTASGVRTSQSRLRKKGVAPSANDEDGSQ